MAASSGSLRQALTERVIVADGAMGTMLQQQDLTLDDFDGLEGCNEILNVTRPDVVRHVHDSYLAVGADCVETNTFGANHANLGEYDISHRIYELARAGAVIAREAADAWSTPQRPRWVLGSVGPGTKLPTLGHVEFATLRDAYAEQTRGMLDGGVDAVLVETAQDLLQAKAAVIGAKRAIAAAGGAVDVPVIVDVTVETTGTMLLGTEIGAALTALEPLGIDVIGLNCATGPAEMSEHLRYLARHAAAAVACMPNAGLPQLTSAGASYPLTPVQLADAHEHLLRRVRPDAGRRMLRYHTGAHPPGRGAGRGPGAGAAQAAPRGRRSIAVRARAVPAGHVVPVDRRTHQRQREQGVPRRHAGRPLGRLRRDRAWSDP